jgi:hypothetical protein
MREPREDPVLRSARREALVILIIWLGALLSTIITCYRLGYDPPAHELRFVLGFPSWVFWGVITPWLACLALSFWFAYGFMKDEDLGDDPAGSPEDRGSDHA